VLAKYVITGKSAHKIPQANRGTFVVSMELFLAWSFHVIHAIMKRCSLCITNYGQEDEVDEVAGWKPWMGIYSSGTVRLLVAKAGGSLAGGAYSQSRQPQCHR